MKTIVFMILQIFFAQFWKLGNIRPCDFFRPIAHERNYLIDYNEPNITGEYQALPKEKLNEKQKQMKKKNNNKNTSIIFSGYSVHVVAGVKMTDFSTLS